MCLKKIIMISFNKYLLNITSECSKFNKNIDLCYKKIKKEYFLYVMVPRIL